MKNLKHLAAIFFIAFSLVSLKGNSQNLIVNNYTSCGYAITPIAHESCDFATTISPCFVPPNSIGNICVSFTTSGVWIDGFSGGLIPTAINPTGLTPSWVWNAIRIINLSNGTGTMVGNGIGYMDVCTPPSYPALNAYPTSTTISCGGTPTTITWTPGPGAGNVTIDII